MNGKTIKCDIAAVELKCVHLPSGCRFFFFSQTEATVKTKPLSDTITEWMKFNLFLRHYSSNIIIIVIYTTIRVI